MRKIILWFIIFTLSSNVSAQNENKLMQLSVQQLLNKIAEPNADVVGSTVSGISSAFASSLTRKACLLNQKENQVLVWQNWADDARLLQEKFIALIQKDKIAFNQFMLSKHNSAQHISSEQTLADNSIQFMECNIQLMELIEKALPNTSLFLKGDFITACALAKAGFYSSKSFLDLDLKAFKNVHLSSQYQNKIDSLVNKISQFKSC